MAGWRDKFRPASFRGVAFQVSGHQADTGGRRVQVHEYPSRDDPYPEDLGRKSGQYSLDAYVVGADYMAVRDALIKACNEAGAGALVHPYLGTIQALCTGCQLSEESSAGRMAKFQLTFVPAGENRYPTAYGDTGRAVEDAKITASSATLDSFTRRFGVGGSPSFVADAGQGLIQKAAASLLGTGGTNVTSDYTRQVSQLSSNAGTLVQAPRSLGQNVLDLIASAGRQAGGGWATIKGLSGLTSFGSDLPSVPTTTATRQVQAENQVALTSLVRRGALIESVGAVPSTRFAYSQQAFDLRNGLGDRLDEEMATASAAGDDQTFNALRGLRSSMARDINGRAPGLANLVQRRTTTTEPALVTSYRIYGDASQEEEIVARNRIRHPGFVPGGTLLEVLSRA